MSEKKETKVGNKPHLLTADCNHGENGRCINCIKLESKETDEKDKPQF